MSHAEVTPDAAPTRVGGFAWLAAVLLALYPVSATLAANLSWLPIPAGDIARATGAVVLMTLALLAALRRVDRWSGVTAIWFAAVLLPFVAYGWLLDVAGLDKEDWRLASLYSLVSVALATVAVRPWERRRRDPVPLLIVGAVMLAANGVALFRQLPDDAERARRQRAAAGLSTPPAAGPAAAAPTRDIYYIILDGFGRPDILRQYYGLDLQPFVAFLRSRGFYVVDQARSNYAQTYLSIASTLNLNYLDDVAATMGTAARDRHPLGQAIRANALMALAHEAGYEIAAITSDYEATLAFDRADRCACGRFGLSELEQATLAATPLAALPLGRWTSDSHRRKVVASFDALEASVPSARRTFVFAHVIAPHPPFLFNADGSARAPSRPLLGFRDGSHFPGSRADYVAGYRDQAQYVVRRLTAIVTRLLDRPGPRPAIVIHGDHGPGSRLDWDDAARSDMRERLAIFSAYHLPDDGPAPYATMTPVNGARALASRYFGVTLPYLPDRSYFSTWMRPFDVVAAPAN